MNTDSHDPNIVPFKLTNTRPKGWATYRDKVIVISVDNNAVKIVSGYISSTAQSHMHVDNVSRVVVWGDHPFNTLADNADDAYERGFDVEDKHLLKRDEALHLTVPHFCQEWFRGIYPPEVSERVSHCLKEFLTKPPFEDPLLKALQNL